MNISANPYPGIRPFRESDCHNFYGREHLVADLAGKLERNRFVSVLGVSGCGKSSLVYAGLIPALRSKQWQILSLRPEGNPLQRLADQLAKIEFIEESIVVKTIEIGSQGAIEAVNNTNILEFWKTTIFQTVDISSQGLVDAYAQTNSSKPLLIIVDQFEELFTYLKTSEENSDQAIKFVNLIVQAARQKRYPIYILVTMRSDFLGNCAVFKGLPEIINEGQFLIPRLNRDQYRDAIISPLRNVGYSIEGSVISRILNEIEDDEYQLPVLQHMLMRTFNDVARYEPRMSTIISNGDLIKALGANTTNSIDSHCNEIYLELVGLNRSFGPSIRKLFQNLTKITTEGIRVKVKASVDELMAITGLSFEDTVTVLNAYRSDGRNFITPSVDKKLEYSTLVDLAHECLMTKWLRLKDWMNEEQRDKTRLKKLIQHQQNFSSKVHGYLRPETLVEFTSWEIYKQSHQHSVKSWLQKQSPLSNDAIKFVEASLNRNQSLQRLKKQVLFVAAILLVGAVLGAFYVLQRTHDDQIATKNFSIESLMHDKVEYIKQYENRINQSKTRENELQSQIGKLELQLEMKEREKVVVHGFTIDSIMLYKANVSTQNKQRLQALAEVNRLNARLKAANDARKDAENNLAFEKTGRAEEITSATKTIAERGTEIGRMTDETRASNAMKKYFRDKYASLLKLNDARWTLDLENIDREAAAYQLKGQDLKSDVDYVSAIVSKKISIPDIHKIQIYVPNKYFVGDRDRLVLSLELHGIKPSQIKAPKVYESLLFRDVKLTILCKNDAVLASLKEVLAPLISDKSAISTELPVGLSKYGKGLSQPNDNLTIILYNVSLKD
jgi:hypothetical protein